MKVHLIEILPKKEDIKRNKNKLGALMDYTGTLSMRISKDQHAPNHKSWMDISVFN